MVWMLVMLGPTASGKAGWLRLHLDGSVLVPVPPLTLSAAVKLAVPLGFAPKTKSSFPLPPVAASAPVPLPKNQAVTLPVAAEPSNVFRLAMFSAPNRCLIAENVQVLSAG